MDGSNPTPLSEISRGEKGSRLLSSFLSRYRRKFLEFLGEAARRYGWLVSAWVLMSNHFHLVIETAGELTQWFNKKYERSGHLFGGRLRIGIFISASGRFLPLSDSRTLPDRADPQTASSLPPHRDSNRPRFPLEPSRAAQRRLIHWMFDRTCAAK